MAIAINAQQHVEGHPQVDQFVGSIAHNELRERTVHSLHLNIIILIEQPDEGALLVVENLHNRS